MLYKATLGRCRVYPDLHQHLTLEKGNACKKEWTHRHYCALLIQHKAKILTTALEVSPGREDAHWEASFFSQYSHFRRKLPTHPSEPLLPWAGTDCEPAALRGTTLPTSGLEGHASGLIQDAKAQDDLDVMWPRYCSSWGRKWSQERDAQYSVLLLGRTFIAHSRN